jgi:hypothetical protein
MNRSRQFLVLFACVGCLLVVATALPSADPRVDSSEGVGWETVVGSGNDTATEDDPGETNDRDGQSDENGGDGPLDESVDIEVFGTVAPGNEVNIDVQRPSLAGGSGPIVVEGEQVGDYGGISNDSVSYTVPFTEELTIAAPEDNVTERFEVETSARLSTSEPLLPGRETTLNATVGSERLRDAAVRVEGEQVAVTGENGSATITVPGDADTVNLSVERDPVAGAATVETADLDVAFTSLLVLPGLPTSVEVSADGTAVAGATVEMDGERVRTDDSGQATLSVPVKNAVTVAVSAGSERTSATADRLYLRLAAPVLVVPSLLIGVAVSYRRFTSLRTRRRHTTAFLSLGSLLAGVAGLLSWPSLDWGGRSRTWSSVPTLSFGLPSFPDVSPSLPSLPEPSLGGLFSGGDDGGGDTGSGGLFGSDSGDVDGTGGSDNGSADRSPTQQVGRHWHRFVAHLGIERPETWTPGQVARRAIAAGYPRQQVRALVETFRAVEYGGHDATTDRLQRVREATRALRETDPEEEEDR